MHIIRAKPEVHETDYDEQTDVLWSIVLDDVVNAVRSVLVRGVVTEMQNIVNVYNLSGRNLLFIYLLHVFMQSFGFPLTGYSTIHHNYCKKVQ